MKSVGLLHNRKFVTKLNRIYKDKVIEFGNKDNLYAKGHLKWGIKYDKVWSHYSLTITFVIQECSWRWQPYHWAEFRTTEIYKGNHNRLRVRNNFESDLRKMAKNKMKLWGAQDLDVNVSLSFPSPPPKTHEPNSKG